MTMHRLICRRLRGFFLSRLCCFFFVIIVVCSILNSEVRPDILYDDLEFQAPRPARVYAGIRYSQKRPLAAISGGRKSVSRIIHQTWRSADLPAAVVPWVSSWLALHQDWEYWFWSYTDIRRLVRRRFPSLLSLYDRYPSDIYRVNMFKYLVMLEYGGVFADIDMECLKPMDAIVVKQDCLVSQEPVEHAYFLHGIEPPLLSNAFMACQRGHPFFRFLVSGLYANVGWIGWRSPFESTGAGFLTQMYERYRKGSLFRPPPSLVTIADAETFQPVLDAAVRSVIENKCIQADIEYHRKGVDEGELQLCNSIQEKGNKLQATNNSYTIHHWEHRLTTGSYSLRQGTKHRKYFTFTNSKGGENRTKF